MSKGLASVKIAADNEHSNLISVDERVKNEETLFGKVPTISFLHNRVHSQATVISSTI